MIERAELETRLVEVFVRAAQCSGWNSEVLARELQAAQKLAWMFDVHTNEPAVLRLRKALTE